MNEPTGQGEPAVVGQLVPVPAEPKSLGETLAGLVFFCLLVLGSGVLAGSAVALAVASYRLVLGWVG